MKIAIAGSRGFIPVDNTTFTKNIGRASDLTFQAQVKH
jgi:hypothetical protein